MTFPTGKLVEVGSLPESHEHIRALIALLETSFELRDSEAVSAARKFLEENAVPQMCIYSTVEQLRDAKVMPLCQEVVVVPKEVWDTIRLALTNLPLDSDAFKRVSDVIAKVSP